MQLSARIASAEFDPNALRCRMVTQGLLDVRNDFAERATLDARCERDELLLIFANHPLAFDCALPKRAAVLN